MLSTFKFLVTIVLFFVVGNLYSRQDDDENQKYYEILNLIAKSKELVVSKRDSALIAANKAQELSIGLHDTIVARTLYNKGAILIEIGKIKEGTELAKKALDIIGNRVNFKFFRGQVYLSLGVAQHLKQNYDEALKFYFKAEKELDKSKHQKYFQLLLSNIGSIYMSLDDYSNGKTYFERGLRLTTKESRAKIPLIVNLVAACVKLRRHSEVLYWARYGEKLAIKYRHAEALSILYNNICESYLLESGRGKRRDKVFSINSQVTKAILDSAFHFANKSLEIRDENGLTLSVELLNNLGRVNFLKGNYKKSLDYYNLALEDANGFKKLQILDNIIDWYLKNNQNQKAIAYYDEYIALDDSLKSKEFDKKIASISAKNEKEKGEAAYALLRKQNEIQRMQIGRQRYTILIFLLVGSLGVLVTYFVLWRVKIKEKLHKANNKYRFLTLQLNPHFVFHVLNSIKHYLLEKNPEQSVKYLTSLSKLMRSILESSEQEKIKISEDYEVIKK